MTSLDHILLATDFSQGAETATALAFEVARKFTARLTLLHVYSSMIYIDVFGDVYMMPADVVDKVRTDSERALESIRQRAIQEGLTCDVLVLQGTPAECIVAAAHSQRAGLIVMGTEGRSGLKRLFLGSVAARVVRTSACPVLTVRSAPCGDAESPTTRRD